jgi:hypothetical protein
MDENTHASPEDVIFAIISPVSPFPDVPYGEEEVIRFFIASPHARWKEVLYREII